MSPAARCLSAFVVLACSSPTEQSRKCYAPGGSVDPEDELWGAPAHEHIDPYLGTFPGTLTWASGGETPFEMKLPYEPGQPYPVEDTFECWVRTYVYHSNAHLWTADGAFDTDLVITITARIPTPNYHPVDVARPDSLPASSVQPALYEHLDIQLERYASHSFAFAFEWARDAPPSRAAVIFNGVIAGVGSDSIQVAEIEFD